MTKAAPSPTTHLLLRPLKRPLGRGAPLWWTTKTPADRRNFSVATPLFSAGGSDDPRLRDLGKKISDEYANLRSSYSTPKYPIVLAHGLLGFSTLQPVGPLLPAIHYWHGIRAALEAQGCTVITPSVPPSGTIAARSRKLAADIAEACSSLGDTPVNVIAHSMGGLDARLAASPRFASEHLGPGTRQGLNVASVVTIATPHRGSTYAEHIISALGPTGVYRARTLLARAAGWSDTGAFDQLTPRYMAEDFNPATPDHPDVRYFSYGAMTEGKPPLLSPFRHSHAIIEAEEGPNDGLVSVESSKWGTYKGTLVGVSHLDLINWSNRVGWAVRKLMWGTQRNYNAIAFYLDIADMLAKEGL